MIDTDEIATVHSSENIRKSKSCNRLSEFYSVPYAMQCFR